MKYLYQARSKEGKIETGIVEASSKEAAAALLQKYNIYVTSLKEQAPRYSALRKLSFLEKVSKKDLAIFSRQLAVMLQSRVSVTQSLAGLAAQTKKQGFRAKIMKISQLIEEGNPLSDAFAEFPEIFSVFYVNLVKTGEASGEISRSLYYLSDHLEREYDIGSQIKGAMIYPIFVITVLSVVILIVMFVVMPKLVDLLKETTSEPPLFTAMMINFYSFLIDWGWVLILGFFILVVFIIYYFRTKEGKKKYDQISLRTPFLGDFLKKIFLIRFAENISTLMEAGVSINSALKITKETVNNFVYKEIISETEARVSEGEKMSTVLIKYPNYIPPFVVQMVQVGESIGRLDKNLMEIVNFYQKEVKRAVDIFTAMLEPILIIFLGIVVALLAISVLSPLYGALGTI
ncbi:MAG: type II secretion system F family protein [Candidatus Staskawiczbacteria bacterium]|nr:type II secretion system F family protein [Candidatus Staskawiczbacteria bacterium]